MITKISHFILDHNTAIAAGFIVLVPVIILNLLLLNMLGKETGGF